MIVTRKFVNIIFILVFIMMLIIPILTINTEKNRKLTSENRVAAQFPTVFDKDGKFMGGGTLTKGLETWINDNIGFRDMAGIIKTKVDWYAFDEIVNGLDLKGEGGWISEGQSHVINDYINYNMGGVGEYVSFFTNIDDVSKSNNIPMIGTLIPDKKDIYPEYFSDNINRISGNTRSEKIDEYIKNNTDMDFIYMYDELYKYKNSTPLYSPRYDSSHWNEVGSFIGYSKLMNSIQQYFPNIDIKYVNDYNINNITVSRLFFNAIPITEKHYQFISKFNSTAIKLNDDWKYNIPLPGTGDLNSLLKYTNDIDAPRVLIFGDSYFRDNLIPKYLKDSFSDISFVYNKNVMEQYVDNPKEMIQYYIDEFKPDLIIGEAVNRVLFEK